MQIIQGSKSLRSVTSPRRLEDRIRTLSEELVGADADDEEFHRLAAELRTALTEHVKRIRNRLQQYPLADDRRSSKKK
jgi:hypothetical protein